MLRFIGLDLSLRESGILTLDSNRKVHDRGISGYPLKKTATELEKISRIIDITEDIMKVVGSHVINGEPLPIVVIERPAYSAKGRQNDLSELQGLVKVNMWLAFNIVPHILVASSARKKVLGNGKLSKKEIVKRCNEHFDLDTDNDNIADAFVLAEHVRQLMVGYLDQMEIFD